MITTTPNKLMLIAGAFLLVAIGLIFPLDAFAQTITGANQDVTQQASTLSKQLTNVPKLIAMGSYVIGAFFAVRALFSLKGFIEAPDDNPVTKVLGFGAVAALLILLPYVLGVIQKSLNTSNVTVQSSSSNFTDTGF